MSEEKTIKTAIERLEGYNQNLLAANIGLSCGMLDEIKAAKSEAIKEFAEIVKNTSEDCTDYGQEYVLCKDIDKLVKEMVGDSE